MAINMAKSNEKDNENTVAEKICGLSRGGAWCQNVGRTAQRQKDNSQRMHVVERINSPESQRCCEKISDKNVRPVAERFS
jgi:hypothetical protein